MPSRSRPSPSGKARPKKRQPVTPQSDMPSTAHSAHRPSRTVRRSKSNRKWSSTSCARPSGPAPLHRPDDQPDQPATCARYFSTRPAGTARPSSCGSSVAHSEVARDRGASNRTCTSSWENSRSGLVSQRGSTEKQTASCSPPSETRNRRTTLPIPTSLSRRTHACTPSPSSSTEGVERGSSLSTRLGFARKESLVPRALIRPILRGTARRPVNLGCHCGRCAIFKIFATSTCGNSKKRLSGAFCAPRSTVFACCQDRLFQDRSAINERVASTSERRVLLRALPLWPLLPSMSSGSLGAA
mmetsp:Transcript_44861/g.144295  ORF Transcript_44861/g.144295 Transcript_44861/m.144295 type:complete len:300 (-) Transcript_44861:81-980(-)